ncbi:universal stress protein [Rhodococcus sp. HNM0569]|uniref:universal stress protein n=1 Tax=Rhodococcus sp. HNM0569 TaxID=2716340 RepID=UPI00146A0B83|nr:universal stress protein [Rhodococcus sp. HNM0569]NLU82526.1 universal stress protein [Rhodococcus sp. HNM0569]
MTSSERTNLIAVGADGSASSTAAVAFAAEMAGRRGADLQIVHSLDFAPYGFGGPYMDAGGVYEWVEEGGKKILADAEKTAHDVAPSITVQTDLSIGSSAQWLVDLSETVRWVVIGASGAGKAATALLLGNTAISVTAHAKCPVVVVRGEARDSGPVVVGVDGSETSKRAVACAFEEASFRAAPLVAVHVWSDLGPGLLEDPRAAELLPKSLEEEERVVLAESLAGYQEQYPDVAVERHVYVDNPRARLVEWSKQAQLVVVGSRGRGGFRGMLLGSTSNTLAAESHSPVMVVRPAE